MKTIIGGHGFLGSEIIRQLKNKNEEFWVPEKNDPKLYTQDLGDVIYCAGHGDCNNSLKVFESNIGLLSTILNNENFNKMVYVSSTRVYLNGSSSNESDDLTVIESDKRKLFNLTKLVGEELCAKSSKDICIVRPSNIYGLAVDSTLFLPSITRDAIYNGIVNMYVTREYRKDYVSVFDVAHVCTELLKVENSDFNNHIYNIASGINISAKEIAEVLMKKTDCNVIWNKVKGKEDFFPKTDISKLKNLMSKYEPSNILEDLGMLIENFKSTKS